MITTATTMFAISLCTSPIPVAITVTATTTTSTNTTYTPTTSTAPALPTTTMIKVTTIKQQQKQNDNADNKVIGMVGPTGVLLLFISTVTATFIGKFSHTNITYNVIRSNNVVNKLLH